MNNIKLDFLEKLIFLENIAEKRPASLSNEFCLFIRTELNLKAVLFAKEISRNQFQIIGKSVGVDYVELFNDNLRINNYDLIHNSFVIDKNLITECLINHSSPLVNYQNLVFSFNRNSLGLLILVHKIKPSADDLTKYHTIVKVINRYFARFFPNEKNVLRNNYFDENIQQSIRGILEELNTSNGLISLIKEENTNNSILNYINDIKYNNFNIQKSLEDLLILADINNEDFSKPDTLINLEESLKEVSKCFEDKNQISVVFSSSSYQIKTKSKILLSALNQTLKILYSLSNNNEIFIVAKVENRVVTISCITKAKQINEQNISKIEEPFNLLKYTTNAKNLCSGFSFLILNHYLQNINGKIKLETSNDGNLTINIVLLVEAEQNITKDVPFVYPQNVSEDKVLIIESNSSSSILLKNYLSKWNYQAVFANSCESALEKLRDKNYVAVILNIEQESENSLQILQKLRNNKFSRNIPVIVFLLESESEKIFLMGSIDYLIKPINYNNLIEILTSYKLTKDSTVLCVDDDMPTLNLLKQAVITAGFNPLAEVRSENVINLIDDKKIDLAIIDLDMPKLNGFELIKLIKSKDKFINLPVIIYTGKDDYQNDLQKIEGLFVDLLEKKSTSLNELEKTIIDFINYTERSKSSEEVFQKNNRPKILMAEDYKHSQIIVTRLLKKNGFDNVIVVENGLDAVKICEKEKVDLILMDMQMPIMNGFEATGKIREIPSYKDTPIIALTAFAMRGDREKCLEAGATDYIPKPIDSKEFIEKVNYYTQVLTTE